MRRATWSAGSQDGGLAAIPGKPHNAPRQGWCKSPRRQTCLSVALVEEDCLQPAARLAADFDGVACNDGLRQHGPPFHPTCDGCSTWHHPCNRPCRGEHNASFHYHSARCAGKRAGNTRPTCATTTGQSQASRKGRCRQLVHDKALDDPAHTLRFQKQKGACGRRSILRGTVDCTLPIRVLG